jgi:spore germination protein GerM
VTFNARTLRRFLPATIGVVLLGLLAWGVTRLLERMTARTDDPAAVVSKPVPNETPHIAATLFYATPEGDALMPIRREVPLAEGVVAQGRQILLAQLEPPRPPYISAIPAGTMLRALYVTERGDAFVDLSGISASHPGGSLTELLTVQAIVNAVTANLPAVQRVQILVDGKEVDTIAGHVDIRRPLTRDTSLVREGEAAAQ